MFKETRQWNHQFEMGFMTHFSKGSWSFPLIYPEYQVSSSSCTFSVHRVHFILFYFAILQAKKKASLRGIVT